MTHIKITASISPLFFGNSNSQLKHSTTCRFPLPGTASDPCPSFVSNRADATVPDMINYSVSSAAWLTAKSTCPFEQQRLPVGIWDAALVGWAVYAHISSKGHFPWEVGGCLLLLSRRTAVCPWLLLDPHGLYQKEPQDFHAPLSEHTGKWK